MSDWAKRTVEWVDGGVAYVSCVFTWLLPLAYQRCVWLGALGYHVRAGGPAVSLLPDYLAGVAEIGGHVDALPHHNPEATFTTRGCIRQCAFCAVPLTEGAFVELSTWDPKPIVCDNNLLASSKRHFDRVIDSLKGVPGVDFNQGLDARLLTDYHAERIAELDMYAVRVAWDKTDDEPVVMAALERLTRAGFGKAKQRVYVLIGFEDSPDDAWYRLETLRAAGIRPNVMRYQPLGAMRRNEYVAPGWTERQLRRYSKYWNRLRWLEHIPFEEYVA